MAGRVTLDELYVLVPSTEEIDLAEEARADRFHAWLVKEYADLLGPLDDDPLPGAPAGRAPASRGAEAEDSGWRPTDAQALGCLEHLLGAQRIEPEVPLTPPPPRRSRSEPDAEDPTG